MKDQEKMKCYTNETPINEMLQDTVVMTEKTKSLETPENEIINDFLTINPEAIQDNMTRAWNNISPIVPKEDYKIYRKKCSKMI